jgi:uncharacterized protein YyaL (SSP411 family)
MTTSTTVSSAIPPTPTGKLRTLEAHRLWPDQGYADIAMRTLDFVETSLKHSDGGYMSSLSAVDHANKEGGAYLWTRAELASLLTADEMAYLAQRGQFESANSEFLIKTLDGPLTESELADKAVILDKLRQHRSGGMPADTKRLAAWNAMLLDALVVAADFDERFAQRARALYRNMRDNFYSNGQLIRFAGNADVAAAALEDYAQVAHAFYNFGRRFDQRAAADDARRLVESAHSLFLKNDRWHQKARSLIPIAPGKWIMPDLVSFSPMTLWLSVAVEVSGLDPEIRESATRMLQRASREMLDSPYFYGSYIVLRIDQSG